MFSIVLDVEVRNPRALDDVDEEVVRQALNRGCLAVASLAKQVWASITIEEGAVDIGTYLKGIEEQGRVEIVKPANPESQAEWIEVIVTITNTSRHASIVEDGHGAFSLVQAINWGSMSGSIKRTRSGKPYIHIPFRHYTPAESGGGATKTALRNGMPSEVYQEAKDLMFRVPKRQGPLYDHERVSPKGHTFNAEATAKAHAEGGLPRSHGLHTAPDGTQHRRAGQFMARDRYSSQNYGNTDLKRTRLVRGDVRTGFHASRDGGWYEERRSERQVGRDSSGKPLRNAEWGSSKFEGMFRTGSPGHANYMTIRTITPDSLGWNIPAMAGYGIAAKTAQELSSAPEVRDLMASSIGAALMGAGHGRPKGV